MELICAHVDDLVGYPSATYVGWCRPSMRFVDCHRAPGGFRGSNSGLDGTCETSRACVEFVGDDLVHVSDAMLVDYMACNGRLRAIAAL